MGGRTRHETNGELLREVCGYFSQIPGRYTHHANHTKRIGSIYCSKRRCSGGMAKYLVMVMMLIAKSHAKVSALFLSFFDFNQSRCATNSTETHSSGSLNPERAQEPLGEHPHSSSTFRPLPLLPPLPHPHEQQATSRG